MPSLQEVRTTLEQVHATGQASADAFVTARTLAEEAAELLRSVNGTDTLLDSPIAEFTALQAGINSALQHLVTYPATINPWLERNGMAPLAPIITPIPEPATPQPPIAPTTVKRNTDLNKRLPRFREALAAIADTRRRGGYEGLSSNVMDRLENMEPVGLDDNRHLVFPENYNPDTCSPVLMILPNETGQPITFDAHEAEVAMARRMSGIARVTTDIDTLKHTASILSGFAAWVHLTPIGGGTGSGMPFLPRITFVGAMSLADIGVTLAHEADHLDFFFGEAPRIQSRRGENYSIDELKTVAEKLGYRTTRHIECNLGYYQPLEPLDELLKSYKASRDITMIGSDLNGRCQAAGLRPAPLAALVIEQLFGKAGERVTSEEVDAFKYYGLI
jgi:hypothetical protein